MAAPLPNPTAESLAIDAMRVAVVAKLDAIIMLLDTYVADIAADTATATVAAAAAEAAAAEVLAATSAHTDRLAVATEAQAHKPSGTANARYKQSAKD